ncbi:TfoX/Sxy family protein [Hoeflea sp. TYP-13]|uniref:TfoX/Sxy family protein n=1 Tax=Hoeflea sp. TYP-13 TaxID=3230023 RepID=UPI0034C6A43D
MAEPYLTQLKCIIDRLKTTHESVEDVSCRHFFSGAAAYAGGHIFMSLSPAGLALKLPVQDRTALFSEGGAPLRYFPSAPVKKGYVVLPPALVADDAALNDWLLRSLKHVRN